MNSRLFAVMLIGGVCIFTCIAQRVAPGVPPQTYQQQQQQQQYQQQQFQQQPPHNQQPLHDQQQQYQQHQQHQQVPVQQTHQQVPIQQQVPVQQVPVPQVPVQEHNTHHGHHGGPPQPGQVLNTANIAHEKEHIAEHLDVPIDTSKMSEQELQFHYFKMHDSDNNNKLDGCELIKSLIHWHGDTEETKEPNYTDEQLSLSVDLLLNQLDTNSDGFIDYSEFMVHVKNPS